MERKKQRRQLTLSSSNKVNGVFGRKFTGNAKQGRRVFKDTEGEPRRCSLVVVIVEEKMWGIV